MRTVRYLIVVISCLLLMDATSHADDAKSTSADVDRPNKAVNHATPRVLSPTTFPSSKWSLRDFRHQGTAVIGGPTNKFRNTAALNGTGMKRKP